MPDEAYFVVGPGFVRLAVKIERADADDCTESIPEIGRAYGFVEACRLLVVSVVGQLAE